MFDYTRAASRKIKKDIDNLAFGLSITTQLFSILYTVYVLLFGGGLLGVKIALLVLTVGYFVFFCAASSYSLKKEMRRKIKLVFQWSKRLIKLVNLGVIIYGFANAEHTTFSIILLAFSILCWGLDLIIGIISFIITAWLQLFLTGVESDLEEYKAKITNSLPFKLFGKKSAVEEVEETPPSPTNNQILLDKMVDKERIAREEKRQRAIERQALLKRQAKEDKINRKKEQKAQKSAEKAAKKEEGGADKK